MLAKGTRSPPSWSKPTSRPLPPYPLPLSIDRQAIPVSLLRRLHEDQALLMAPEYAIVQFVLVFPLH